MREDSAMEEIRQNVRRMSPDELQKYLKTLSTETLDRYGDYVLQRARRILENEINASARES